MPTTVLPALAREVFAATYGAPTRAQSLAWPVIAAGGHALVVAPTGSGKTLAAFYAFLARMIETPPAEPGVELVYVSPLKALATDIERNLRSPLAALVAESTRRGLAPAPIGVVVRHGDTPSGQRAAMLRRPPRILVTTPESLYLVLTSPKGRDALRAVRAVIVDEVHALVPTKRGVHLALSLERLERLAGRAVQRVGLSATVAPLDEAARWLGGRDAGGDPRPVTVLDAGERKEVDLAVIAPADPAVVGPRGVWPPIVDEVRRIVAAHRSTLVFCNGRRLAERVTTMLNEGQGAPIACSHHGSVSRERRREVEDQLKAGRLRAVVATGSLELGIDVGAVDCVVQLASPKAVSRALQRIGRSGHVVGGLPKGRVIPTSRADIIESAAVARAVLRREIEETHAPGACLDILAQQIVAEVAACGEVSARELYGWYRRAHSYRGLPWEDFVGVVEMLSGRYQLNALREMKPRVDWDRRRGRLAALPGSRMLATSRPGAIPDRGLFRVEREETRERLGELDEEFVFEARVGEAFVLGATAWKIARILKDRVIVRAAAPGEPAKMPFWRGEGLGRTFAVGQAVGALVREVAARVADGDAAGAVAHVRASCAADEVAARALVEHVERQRQAGEAVPDDRTVVVERYEDELGDARVALLSPYGGRVHAAWAILLAAELRRRLELDVPHVPTDDGILFRAPSGEAAEKLLGLARWVPSAEAAERLAAEIDATPLYAGLFRDAAQRSLILPGRGPSGRTPLWLARLRAADMAELMRGHPDFPVAREARREALEDALDLRGLVTLLAGIERGEVRVLTSRRSLPSPFAAGLELAFTTAFLYEGDSPRLERRARALAAGPAAAAMLLAPEELEELIDPAAVAQLEARRQHLAEGTRARTPEELAEILRRLGDLDDAELAARAEGDAAPMIAALARSGRITRLARPGGGGRWILDEDAELWRDLDDGADAGRVARAELAGRYAAARGPFQTAAFAERYALPVADAAAALEALVRDGLIVRGRFVRGAPEPSWCDRKNLAEAHRRTLSILRDRAAPVGVAQLARFLVDRHHAADVAGAVHMLSGFQAPQESFERDLLWRRVSPYHPPLLDAACAAGDVTWAYEGGKLTAAPRGELELWLSAAAPTELPADESTVLATLEARGAMFGPELVEASRLRPGATYAAVWSLVRRGLVTNDAYEALRRALAIDFDPVEAGLEHGGAHVSMRTLMSRVRRTPWVGRFSRLVPDPAAPEERAARQAAILLRRYGIVGKAVADAEPRALPWPLLEEALAGLELRGEVVRGYFVEGLGAYQVAVADAVDELRARRDTGVLTLINACDPACPYGSLAPDSEGRVARLPSTYLVLRGGSPLLLVESFGKRITPLAEAPDDVVAGALATLRGLLAVPAHLRGVRSVTVHTFGDREAAAAQALFARAGFARDADRMVLSAV